MQPPDDIPRRLSQYPHGRLTVVCTQCRRRGSYSVARLAVRFGAEVELDVLLMSLTASCPWQFPPGTRGPRKYQARCLAFLAELSGPRPPTRERLRVLQGGKPDPEA